MPIPSNKKELISAITIHYQQLKVELAEIPESNAYQKAMNGHRAGTKMSAGDLVAYLIGWGTLVIKWNKKMDKGQTVDFPETGYAWNELGALAQKFYNDYQGKSWPQLLKQLHEVVNEILRLIESKSNQQLYGKFWYKKYSLGRMMQLNTSSPYKKARLRIRRWIQEGSQSNFTSSKSKARI